MVPKTKTNKRKKLKTTRSSAIAEGLCYALVNYESSHLKKIAIDDDDDEAGIIHTAAIIDGLIQMIHTCSY